jgi:hypothetical protein
MRHGLVGRGHGQSPSDLGSADSGRAEDRREAAEKAKQVGAKTDREKAFIGAIATFYADSDKVDHKTRMLAYEAAMAALERDHPKDREAAIFHALSLLGVAQPNDKTYAKQKQAAEILNRVLPEEPEHPGVAHYLIHSFDYPELAELALPAARVYAKLAPGSPHALHMPSHIFTRLGLWDESIASNLASAEKAHNYVAHAMPGAAAFDELHAVDYLVYAYLQQGKIDEARSSSRKRAPSRRSTIRPSSRPPTPSAPSPRDTRSSAGSGKKPPRSPCRRTSCGRRFRTPKRTSTSRAASAARDRGSSPIARDAVSRLAAIRQTLLDQKNTYWADQVEIQRLSVPPGSRTRKRRMTKR